MPAALSVDDLQRFTAELLPSPSELDRLMGDEAAFGLSRILPLIAEQTSPLPRLLEIGGGPLILSGYLARRGFEVTVMEPTGHGFDFFADLQRRTLERVRAECSRLTVFPYEVERLDAQDAFDVAFSINAFEHMADPYGALDVIHRALRPGGRLLVHCPNYDVPFDSHFGLWLVTRHKPFNEWLYRERIASRRAVWDGLTFVRLSRLRRYCLARRYDVSFNRGMLQHAVLRLRDDAAFSKRLPPLVRRAGRLLGHPRLAGILPRVPLRLQTPMELVLRK